MLWGSRRRSEAHLLLSLNRQGTPEEYTETVMETCYPVFLRAGPVDRARGGTTETPGWRELTAHALVFSPYDPSLILSTHIRGATMRRLVLLSLLAGAIALGAPAQSGAQEDPALLAAGEMAPDIELTGATRYGVIAEPVHLSDYRGETVVLAFFFRARSRG